MRLQQTNYKETQILCHQGLQVCETVQFAAIHQVAKRYGSLAQ
jgi:hypothetical protein